MLRRRKNELVSIEKNAPIDICSIITLTVGEGVMKLNNIFLSYSKDGPYCVRDVLANIILLPSIRNEV